jgi:integrase
MSSARAWVVVSMPPPSGVASSVPVTQPGFDRCASTRFATRLAACLVARHANARFVQEFLGHARITTTERYMHAKARPQDIELVNLAFGAAAKADGA